MYKKIIIILIITITYIFGIIELIGRDYKLPKSISLETFALNNPKITHNPSIGGESKHLEMAYTMCQSKPGSVCPKYIYHYDGLRKTFSKLKDEYCKDNSSHCMELGL